ncbi:MAG: glycosylhydrolase-like jelly roll fold domain-containing protein [Calditrichaceae bacterium]
MIPQKPSQTVSAFIDINGRLDNAYLSDILVILNSMKVQSLSIRNISGEPESFFHTVQNSDSDINCTRYISHNSLLLLNKNRDRLRQMIQPLLFCTNQYYKNQNFFGFDIFRFWGDEPEIYIIKTNKKHAILTIPSPEDIEAVFMSPGTTPTQNIKDITEYLNPNSGVLHVRTAPVDDIRIIVIRKLLVYFEKKPVFYHDYSSLTDGKIDNNIDSNQNHPERGIYFDLDRIIKNDFLVSSTDSIRKAYKKSTQSDFIYDMTEFLLNGGKSFSQSIKFNRFFCGYIDTEIHPLLSSKKNKNEFTVNAINSLIPGTQFSSKCIFMIDEKQFYPESPYLYQVIANLKRASAQALKDNITEIKAGIHDIINTGYSFREKKYQIDYLMSRGVNRFYFKLPAFDNKFYSDLPETDPNFKEYIHWYDHLRGMELYLREGKHRPEFLIVYPDLDEDKTSFFKTIKKAEELSLDYDVIEFSTLEDDKFCQVENGKLKFRDKNFKFIILPGIDTLPLTTLKKLAAFYANGGFVIALAQLPLKDYSSNNQDGFNELKSEIWPEEADLPSTHFKLNGSGGMGYFQENIDRFSEVLQDLKPHIIIFPETKRPGLKYILRETDESYILFLFNSNRDEKIEIKFRTRLIGVPYKLEFGSTRKVPVPEWICDSDGLTFFVKLHGGESNLIIIDKTKAEKYWQLSASQMDHCEILKQNESELELTGWQRELGDYSVTVRKDTEIKKLTYQIKNKLAILVVSTENWFLESKHFKNKVHLGDQSAAFPFYSDFLTYHKLIVINEDYLDSKKLLLDLGDLSDWCRLSVNDQFVGSIYSPPWFFDITNYVTSGENKISITVANNLSNYLAGQNAGCQNEYFSREYGLYGPVRLIPYSQVHLKL